MLFMKRNSIKTCLLLVAGFAMYHPSTSQSMKSAPDNPTSYIFEFKIQTVSETIKKEFLRPPGYRYMQLEYFGKDVILSSTAKKVFQDSNNRKDYYLHYSNSIGKSKICFNRKGYALDYYAEFHLHLTAIDSTQTRVEILTIDPKVVTGRNILPSLPHLVRMDKTKSINPSSIEEYEILLKIGKSLGVEEKMPKIKLP